MAVAGNGPRQPVVRPTGENTLVQSERGGTALAVLASMLLLPSLASANVSVCRDLGGAGESACVRCQLQCC